MPWLCGPFRFQAPHSPRWQVIARAYAWFSALPLLAIRYTRTIFDPARPTQADNTVGRAARWAGEGGRSADEAACRLPLSNPPRIQR